VPIHVDAASGGFIAPFLYPELEWDFRLPLVKSINVSGHKYGLVYAGVGWVIWRSKEDLPDELIFHINYLGTDQPTFTLNFSKGTSISSQRSFGVFRLTQVEQCWNQIFSAGSSQIIAQYYQLIRLGFEVIFPFSSWTLLILPFLTFAYAPAMKPATSLQGYKSIMQNCMANTAILRDGLAATGRFEIVSKVSGVPLVAFSIKDSSACTVFDVSDNLRRFGWIVPAYTMPPNAEHVAVLRVVIREDFSRSLAERLVSDILKVVQELDERSVKVASVIAAQKSSVEIQREIITRWRKVVDKKTGPC
jgi:glutamate decarboxylase